MVLGLAALAITVHRLGGHTIVHQFRMIGWWWLLVIGFEMTITGLDALAIRSFASPDRVSMRTALLAQLAGRSINVVTPGASLGEAVKVSVLTDALDGARAVAAILLYNIVGFVVELLLVALAAPFMALLVPMREGARVSFLVAGAVALVVSLGLYFLVRRGMLASVVKLGVRLRLVSQTRFDRWQTKLASVDDKLRLTAGARRRDRIVGIGAVVVSRTLSTALSLVLMVAIGEHVGIAFVAAYVVGGFVIYIASNLVPMGVGVSEGGYYGLFTAMHAHPVLGVVLVLSRRCVLVVYAAVGFLLVLVSETVRRARTPARSEVTSM